MANAATAPVSKRRTSRRSPARHWLVQNTPLVLSFVILAITLSAWIFFYYGQLGRFPDSFDVTQVTNSSLPLVFAALGQSFVVLTRGLDLSVGGTISLSTAVTAQMMSDSPGSILFWSAVVLVMGAVIGLVNGLLVARARLAPILVTLATLSILQGLAIFVLPKPGGLVPETLTNVLTSRSAPTGLVFVALVDALVQVEKREDFAIQARFAQVLGDGTGVTPQDRFVAVARVPVRPRYRLKPVHRRSAPPPPGSSLCGAGAAPGRKPRLASPGT